MKPDDVRLKNLKPIAPGEVRNPNGRPLGSRNKFGEAFINDFMKEWEVGGAEALRRVREEDPSTFLRVAASILPKELNINEGESALERLLEQYSDRELNELIAGLSAIGAHGQVTKGKDKADAAKRPDKVH